MMSWIDDEIEKRRLDERGKQSETTGRVHKFEVKVSLDGTTMMTVIFAENIARAKKIAAKLYGQRNIKSQPVKK